VLGNFDIFLVKAGSSLRWELYLPAELRTGRFSLWGVKVKASSIG
jgi:hypothetical protein